MEIGYARLLPRFKGLLLDALWYVGATFVAVVFLALLPPSWIWAFPISGMLASWLLYEPVLVWVRGGTFGHSAMNLRVVPDEYDGNLSFPRALARSFLKSGFGWVSFVFMALTRRHQTLHDLATRSTVQIRDLAKAERHAYALERREPVGAIDVSVPRRVAVIAGYCALSYAAMVGGSYFMTSEACAFYGQCGAGEMIGTTLLSWAWIAASCAFLIFGWQGRLFGARSADARS